MKTESVAPVQIPTDEQVVAFFQSKLAAFQAKIPGYASFQLDYSIHTTGTPSVSWKVYHESNGHSPENYGAGCDEAFKWHFSSGVILKKIEALRTEAAEKLKLADELEHATQ